MMGKALIFTLITFGITMAISMVVAVMIQIISTIVQKGKVNAQSQKAK